ncbi:g6645 [Coccomyxa viridis]|uniref:G6645 protein n=1 Tax=Coccomyxa viridis TaxID=1274662 RepID=A0ABP1FZU9_9CHLO
MHTAKTGGSTLREIIGAGAAASGIPISQQFIPCYNGLDCSTFGLPHRNYSIIAGHFTWRELQRVGLHDFSCVVSVRQPVDRVVSCLSYNTPRDVMESVHALNRSAFQRLMTKETSCNNGLLSMLMPSMAGMDNIEDSINSNNLNATISQTIVQAAIDNMKRCIIVDLFDDMHDEGLPDSSTILARYFPWMQPPQELPKLRQRRLAYYEFQVSHLQQIARLNHLDTITFKAALKQMRQQ